MSLDFYVNHLDFGEPYFEKKNKQIPWGIYVPPPPLPAPPYFYLRC